MREGGEERGGEGERGRGSEGGEREEWKEINAKYCHPCYTCMLSVAIQDPIRS